MAIDHFDERVALVMVDDASLHFAKLAEDLAQFTFCTT
jgi:hypothetical protein